MGKKRGLKPEHQAVTALPELIGGFRTQKDEFIVMACDGIWDVMTSQEVTDFVRQRLRKGLAPGEVAKQLLHKCLSPNPKQTNGLGTDNMTCIIVVLEAPPLNASFGSKFNLPSIFQKIAPSK